MKTILKRNSNVYVNIYQSRNVKMTIYHQLHCGKNCTQSFGGLTNIRKGLEYQFGPFCLFWVPWHHVGSSCPCKYWYFFIRTQDKKMAEDSTVNTPPSGIISLHAAGLVSLSFRVVDLRSKSDMASQIILTLRCSPLTPQSLKSDGPHTSCSRWVWTMESHNFYKSEGRWR